MFEPGILNTSITIVLAFLSGWQIRKAYAQSKRRLSLEERDLIEKEVATMLAQAEVIDKRVEHNIRQGMTINYWLGEAKELREKAQKKLAYLRLYNAG